MIVEKKQFGLTGSLQRNDFKRVTVW